MNPVLAEIERLFAARGDEAYGEGVTQTEHMVQAAALAEGEGAPDALVVAALLHDIGHLITPPDDAFGYHKHDRSGGDWLARHFGPAVSEPVRLHVAAKRYLCRVEPGYAAVLSPASVYTLSKQGGPMSTEEAAAFAAQPFVEAAVRVRRWDDGAKVPDAIVPDLGSYMPRIERLLRA